MMKASKKYMLKAKSTIWLVFSAQGMQVSTSILRLYQQQQRIYSVADAKI